MEVVAEFPDLGIGEEIAFQPYNYAAGEGVADGVMPADNVGTLARHLVRRADRYGAGFLDCCQQLLVGFEVGQSGLGFFEFFFCHWLPFLSLRANFVKGRARGALRNGLVQTVYE